MTTHAICRHFNGTDSVVCKAGIAYLDVKSPARRGLLCAIPCILEYNVDGVTCAKFEEETVKLSFEVAPAADLVRALDGDWSYLARDEAVT